MDELLSRVDESRRGFLRKVIGGAFAAPMLASFSMNALVTSSAEAQNGLFCANQTFQSCCELALCLAEDLDAYRDRLVGFLDGLGTSVASARKQAMIKSVSKAIEFINAGILEGEGTCMTAASISKFTYARGWIVNLLEVMEDAGLSSSEVASEARELLARTEDLIACASDQRPD